GRLEYDFIIAPGADPAGIQFAFDGASGLSINPSSDLAIGAGFEMQQPNLYQRFSSGELRSGSGRYRLGAAGRVSFEIGCYDRHLPLIVDPVLNLSSLFGGEKDDSVVAITSQGDIVGVTSSVAFGDGTQRRGKDIFLANGQQLIIIGGSDDDVATSAVATTNSLL